jgi:hypothetical protein
LLINFGENGCGLAQNITRGLNRPENVTPPAPAARAGA